MAKVISDDKLLEMLLIHGGVSGAATALKMSKSAIYKRLQGTDLRKRYDMMQGLILSNAAAELTDCLSDAIHCLRDTANGTDINPSIRVQAASAILTHCNRYIESADILRRLDALENNREEETE